MTFKGSRVEANRKLRELIGQADKGALPEPSKLTVAAYVEDRIKTWQTVPRKNREPIGLKTAERARELLDNQIRPHIGDIALQKLSTTDIETWHGKLLTAGRVDGKPLHPRTALHAHRLLSKALDDALRHGLVVANVAAVQGAVKVPEDDQEEVVIIDGAEKVKAVVAALRDRTIFPPAMIALFCGLRRGEILALRRQDVDLDAKLIHVRLALEETKEGIRAKPPKTKNSRRDVAVPDFVVDILRDYRRQQLELRVALGLGKLPDDALLFPKLDGSHQSPRAFSAAWADVAAGIGISEITFHSLRHTHVSQLIDAGVDVLTISRRVGHKDANITLKVYSHLFDRKRDKAAEAINAALAGFGQS
jgi:integrase